MIWIFPTDSSKTFLREGNISEEMVYPSQHILTGTRCCLWNKLCPFAPPKFLY